MRRSRQRLRRRERPQATTQRASTAPLQHQETPQPHQLVMMQRTYGNRHTRAYLQRTTEKEKAALQQALYGLEMMLYYDTTKATVLQSVPADYREAIQAVNVATTHHQGYPHDDIPEAEQAVQDRYMPLGLKGLLLVGLHKDELVLRERVERQNKAVRAWRVAYPAVQDLLNDCQAAGISVAHVRPKISALHKKIIDKLPELSTQLTGLPEEVELIEVYFKAKSTANELDTWLKKSSAALKTATDTYKLREADLELSGDDPKVWEGKAVTALKALKTATATPEAWANAVKDYQEGKKIKGGVGMVAAAKDFLSDTALPVVKYGVGVSETIITARQWKSATAGSKEVLATTASFAKLKGGLDKFEKGLGTFGAVVDVVSGIVELSDGLNENSYESIVGGSLSLAEGGVTLLLGTGAGAIAAPFFLWAKALGHVVGETVKMYNAFHIHDMKQSLSQVITHAQLAADATNAFMIAAHEHDALADAGSTNPVDSALRESYQKMAIAKAESMIRNTERFVSALFAGKLGQYDVMIQSFDQGAGGTDAGRQIMDKLAALADTAQSLRGKPNATESLIDMGHELSELMPKVLAGVQYVAQTVRGIDTDNQSIAFFSPDQHHDSLELVAEWSAGASKNELTLHWVISDFAVKSPIRDKGYHQNVYNRHKGKRIDSIGGIPINIHVKVLNGTMILHIRDGSVERVTFADHNDIPYTAMGYRQLVGGKAAAVLDNRAAADLMAQKIGTYLKQAALPTSPSFK